MKILSLQTTGKLSTAVLAAAAIAFLGLAPQVEAGVTWLASDDGINLTLTTVGSLDTGGLVEGGVPNFDFAAWDAASAEVYNFNGDINFAATVGSVSGNDPWVVASTLGTSDGHSFGFSNVSFQWDTVFGVTPGAFTPVSTMTFAGLTVASAFGANLDAGPVVLWTVTETGDTISVAKAIPEPSRALLSLAGLGAIGLRRRRI